MQETTQQRRIYYKQLVYCRYPYHLSCSRSIS
ncbi:hypothetical protein NP493_1276g00045 [Ridgeia piscesae]|uniref:Uncharacterized protein n=1 Tax=Ridgeia piscesae TaxID=27915 RepID=A0AAD9K9P8_RIDPI|nr:hypothetical protein NP493_1276g00045 [Ridgeia piscesae]